MKIKYWNALESVVDMASVLTEGNPQAKSIIGGLELIVGTKGTGITNSSAFAVVNEMSKSSWNDIKDTNLTEIAKIIGADTKIELKTDASQKETGFWGKVWSFLSTAITVITPFLNPDVAKIVGYVDVVVKAKDAGISNEAVKDTLVAMSKSAWNNLDSKKIEKIVGLIGKK